MAGGYPFLPVDLSGSYVGSAPASIVGTVASGVTDDGTAPVKVGALVFSTSPTFVDGQRGTLKLDLRGNLGVSIFGSGTNSGVGAGTTGRGMSPGTNRLAMYGVIVRFNGTTYDHDIAPNAAPFFQASNANNTTPVLVKAGACNIDGVSCFSKRASECWVKLWDKSTPPIVGTDAPKYRICVAAGATIDRNLRGYYFANGCYVAITTGEADTDNTAAAAGDIRGLQIVTT